VEAVTRIINDGDGYIPVGYDDNGEFGGFDPSRGRGGGREEQNDDWVEEIIPCRAPSAIGRIIGKGGSCVSQIEQECGVRIQVDKRMLECVVSGTPENVKLAVVKCLQVMEEGFGGAVLRVNCTGFEGAIIGPGGKRVRSIAGQTNARVDIEKIGYGESECVIKGSPDAVAAAETVVLQIIAEETANAGYGTASGGGGDRGGWNDRDDESLSFGDTPQRGGYDGLQDDRYDNRQSEYNETREAPRGGRGGGYGYGGGGGYDDKPRDDARGGYDDRGGYGGRGGGGGRGRGGGRGEGRGRESARTGGYDSGYGAPEQRVQYYDERVEGGDRFSGGGRGGGGEGGRGGSRGRGQSKGGSSRYSGGYAE
jgi:rRNA processing protein Krr1/Pno1|tara:strand:- start:3981 stop:5078 length:1098 start_codon:yes stop_codon:yes gene_type:complete